jgi:hypothetical protein
VLACVLLENGLKNLDQFCLALKDLTGASTFSESYRAVFQSITSDQSIQSTVSLFVSTIIGQDLLCPLLRIIAKDYSWRSHYYHSSALVSFPGLVSKTIPYFAKCTFLSATPDLLVDITYDDELRYITKNSFESVELSTASDVKSIVQHFEDGLIYDGMRLTIGRWKLIGDCVSTGRTSIGLTAAFEEVDESTMSNGSYTTKFEQFVHVGLTKRVLADWVIEQHSFTDKIEAFYEPDSTLADPVRAQQFADFLRSVTFIM